jgi:hypothetical protein
MSRSARDNQLGKLWHKSLPQKKRPTCYTDGCNNRCALNHALKQKGIVSNICESGHVRELRSNWFEQKNYYSLQRVGWEKATAVYGFCSKCDFRIFSPIENPEPITPSNSSQACRYSLRPVIHEIRKKEGIVKYLQERDRHIKFDDPELSPLAHTIRGIELLKSIALYIERGINQEVDVEYVVRRIPRIDICASSILLHPVAIQATSKEEFCVALKASASLENSSFNIINIFPFKEASIIISVTRSNAGKNAEQLQKNLAYASDIHIQKIISNMLIAQIEDWAISETLYAKLPKDFNSIITTAKLNQHAMFYFDFGFNFFNI